LLKETIEHLDHTDHAKNKPTNGPNHRSREQLKLEVSCCSVSGLYRIEYFIQECVHRHTKLLLHVDTHDSDSDEPATSVFVTTNDSERFERTKNPEYGPSIDRFEIDLKMPKSYWNRRLSIVFTAHFIQSGMYGYTERESDAIAASFLTYVKTVRYRIIKSQGDNVIEKYDQLKRLAANQRR